jgi:uncharacterized membrane protein YqjE
MANSDRPAAAPPRDALARLIDGVQTLFREHLALAKAELKEDVRRAGRSVLLSAAGVPPLFAGYLLLMVAIALLIALALPGWVAFAIVALLNLTAGGLLTLVSIERVRKEKLALSRTTEELRRDREWIASLGEGSAPSGPAARVEPPGREPPRIQPAATPSGKAGATSTRNGEPITVERTDALHH